MKALISLSFASLLPLAAHAQDTGCGPGEGSLEDIAITFAENVLLHDLEHVGDPECVWWGGGEYHCVDRGHPYPDWVVQLDYPQYRVAHGTLERADLPCLYYDFTVGCARGAEIDVADSCEP